MSTLMTVGPLTALDGPLPVPRLYTLVSTAPIVSEAGERWGAGANVWPYPVDEPVPWGPCAEGEKPGFTEQPNPVFQGFTVVMPIFCDLASIGYAEFRRRVEAAFTARESHAVERAFLAGEAIPLSNFVADANVVLPIGDTAVNADHALGVLEDYIGRRGGTGMIHATPAGVTALDHRGVLEGTTGNGALLRTANGTPVANGTGYIGIDPSDDVSPSPDPADDYSEAWLWATDPVQIRRTEVYVPAKDMAEALDRATNDVAIYAERNYLVTWDTFTQAAVKIVTDPS